jgi:hypothetical protein
MKKLLLVIAGFILIGLYITTSSCRFVDDGVETAHQEYDPSAMLKKYEWFKNQSARIQKMDQDITNAKTLRDGIRSQFEADNGKDHKSWDPVTRKQYQDKVDLQDQMVTATVSQRNSIVADYNAQSAKFNWASFKTNDDLPPTTFEAIK